MTPLKKRGLWLLVVMLLMGSLSSEAQEVRMLRTVVVKPGPNMADTVVLKAVANMQRHNYRNLSSHAYDFYSQAFIQRKGDTSYLFFSENAGRHLFLAPDHERETVLATRTTGTRKKIFASMLTQLQSASFYNKEIDFLDMKFVNPLSVGTTDRYFFSMEDTLYGAVDTQYVISFRPRQGRTFVGLTGRMTISSRGYALSCIEATPAGRYSNLFGSITSGVNTAMTFSHRFECDSAGHWRPRRYVTSFEITVPPQKDLPHEETMVLTAVNDFVTFEANAPLTMRDFRNADDVEVDARSEYRDAQFWQTYRSAADDSVLRRSEKCYDLYDSVGAKLDEAVSMDKLLGLVESVADGYIPVWQSASKPVGVHVDINRLYNRNDYEGARVGLGGELYRYLDGRNVKLAMSAYGAFGMADRRWKEGAALRAASTQNHRLHATLYADNTVEPFAGSSLTQYNIIDISNNANYCYNNMMGVKRIGLEVGWRQWRRWDISVGLRRSREECLFPHYAPSGTDLWNNVLYREVVMTVHWQNGISKLTLGGEGVGSLSLTQRPSRASADVEVVGGLCPSGVEPSGIIGLSYNVPYLRLLAQYNCNLRLARRGDLIFHLHGGFATPGAPATRLFSLGGTAASHYYYRNSFLTLPADAFLVSAFAQGTLCFVFERPLWNTRSSFSTQSEKASVSRRSWCDVLYSRPFLFVQTSALVASLHQVHAASAVSPLLPTAPEGLLFEPAAGLDGLLRWKILDAGIVVAYNQKKTEKNAKIQYLDNISVLFSLNVRID